MPGGIANSMTKHRVPVSGLAIFKGNEATGVVPNRVFALFATEPEQVGLTLNSDTP
jgi:hypothetical protein